MKTKVFLSQEECRRDSYKLLSECYYLPDEGLIKMLRSLDTSKDALHLGIVKNIPETSDIDSLVIDYSKLFVGPYGLLAPLYGSIYLEHMGRVMGNSTVDVRNRYAEEGLNIILKEPPDHVAIELEFIYYLISKEVEAIKNSDTLNTIYYLKKRKDFLEIHLGVWVPNFADKVLSNAETAFYRNLACLTKSFIEEDLESLSNISRIAYPRPEPANSKT